MSPTSRFILLLLQVHCYISSHDVNTMIHRTPAFAPCGSSIPLGFRSHNRFHQASETHRSRSLKVTAGSSPRMQSTSPPMEVVLVGVAADSGCGKSTFLSRLSNIMGGSRMMPNTGRETNTMVSSSTTVICLDDYHKLDREARKELGVTALAAEANDFDLMYEHLKALKEGRSIEKPVYNHMTGKIDPLERVEPTPLVVVQGFHPMYDERVRELLDISVYLDVSEEVKFAWKIQRDMLERGRTLEQIRDSLALRKTDYEENVAIQKRHADMVLEVLPTQLIAEDKVSGEVLRVRMVHREDTGIPQPYLFDEGSTISWTPCGRKLTCSFPGIRFQGGPDDYYGNEVGILEMDGKFDKLDELLYVENHLRNTGSKFYGEITQNMLGNSDAPGSDNGTGLFQTIIGMKIRESYEKLQGTLDMTESDQSYVD